MATVDELSVRIAADTADFQAGAEGVESQLGDLSSEAIQTAASLEILSNRADDAGDNISQAGRRATQTSAQFSALSGATSAANASFMGISATTWASLIPAFIALGAALAPVVGALGGFVAVAGAIGGIGIVGTIGAIATNTEELRSEFTNMLDVLRSEFAPVFDAMTNVLGFFITAFQRVIPLMVPAEDVITRLAGNFAQLGVSIIDMLPAFTDLAVTLATEFLPPFVTWMQDILPELPGMIQAFVDVFRRMLPRFMEAGRLMAELLPPFTEFGFTVLEVLGPALATAAEQGTRFLEWFNELPGTVQRVGGALAVVAPILSVIGQLFGGVLLSAGTTLVTSVLAPFAAGLSTIGSVASAVGGTLLFVGNLFGMLASAILPTTGLISGLVATVSSLAGTFSAVLGPILTVVSILGPAGLVAGAVLAAIGLFTMFESEIRSAIGQVVPIISRGFNQATAWLQSTGASLLRTGMKAIGSAVRAGAIAIWNIVANPSQSVILGALSDAANWLIANGPGILNRAWNTLVDLALAAWRGFREGLIGNSIIPETINAAADYLATTGAALIATGFAKMLTTGYTWANQFKNLFIDVWNFLIGGFGDAFNSILGTIESGINGVIGLINQAISTIPWDVVPGMSAPDQLSELDVPEISSQAGQFERATTDRQVIRERVVEQIATITVEDGEIVAKMDERANNALAQEQRRTRQRQGRNPTPR